MPVSVSTHVTILKAPELNNCPLKISLIRISQDAPYEIKDNIVVKMFITNYVDQKCTFTMRVIFSNRNLHFTHLKNTIRSQESLVFVVGQLEIINNEFYVYSGDINFVDIHSMKKKNDENFLLQDHSAS